MSSEAPRVDLNIDKPIWERFFTIAPLVVIGSREEAGYDLAPKHLACPLGWENYFGFVCSPRHATYHNIQRTGEFTVSFPRPDQVVLTSLTAMPRCDEDGDKQSGLAGLPTEPAQVVDGVLVTDAYAHLECELDRVIDGFGPNSLIVGRVVSARIASDSVRESDASDGELIDHTPLLAYVAPGRYATISESRPFPFPAGFKR